MSGSEEMGPVERVAREICKLKGLDPDKPTSQGPTWQQFGSEARRIVDTIQSPDPGIPIYRHPDATDEFVKPE